MDKHTPGPWTSEGACGIDAADGWVAVVLSARGQDDRPNRRIEEIEANARLIGAAWWGLPSVVTASLVFIAGVGLFAVGIVR
jgi:hypothetical protein